MTKEVSLIKEAVNYLLDAELLEENGWTKEDVEILKKISETKFELVWK